ncbi:hypothetical protein [Lactococcus allomyrinae]|uniref:DUF4355 domain-containing protein n=1 Tax=Lactococcus allomyrinae TaxID=2419773 RepID=A0A387BK91_9LACT|nr:hypothetical protein [Lactococcus allomyrinae]AYG01457.1 hypothetical protein D7I46_10495 [Lactococcus allomyrinae]
MSEYENLMANISKQNELKNQGKQSLPATPELREAIAVKHNLPAEMAERLRGEDEQSLIQDAEYLSQYVKKTVPTAPLKSTEPIMKDPLTQSLQELVHDLTGQ